MPLHITPSFKSAIGRHSGVRLLSSALILGLFNPTLITVHAQTPLTQTSLTQKPPASLSQSHTYRSANTPALENTETYSLDQIGSSSLLFKTSDHGKYLKAPTIDTDVKINISGPVIRTTLSQTFKNESPDWVEGVYVFPLPENAAVDQLRIIVGGRFIEGQIKEKQLAKKIYTEAKAAGKKAGLVEQERPNIFTASVANIGPHESVAIQIEYQDKAEISQGKASLVFPMTVAPRYSPPPQTVEIASQGNITMAVLDPVLDRHRISPPLMAPTLEPTEYLRLPVNISVNLDAGFDLDKVESAYHEVEVSQLDEDSAKISLKDGEIPANRDFKLTWQAKPKGNPQETIFKETIGQDTFLLTLLTPPDEAFMRTDTLVELSNQTESLESSRESLFIIDTSGSMGGKSIEQARDALLLGLNTLEAGDTFNIVRFSSGFTHLFKTPQPVTERTLSSARRFIKKLEAKGGTQMVPALDFMLSTKADPNRIRQVIFMTDGSIGNETQLFALIKDKLGSGRLFPVGIGSAPNRFFLSRAAKFGRGKSVIIGSLSEVRSEMEALFKALDTPVLTHINMSLQESGESYPSRLPDLYTGDPLISLTKVATLDLPQTLTLSGRQNTQNWSKDIALSDLPSAKGIATLWARRKIQDLEENRFDRQTAGTIDAQILQTALDHHLVSRLTSLVAVDITPSREVSEALIRRDVPTMLPEGWVFGKLAGLDLSMSQNYASPPPSTNSDVQNSPTRSLQLPSTASPHIFLIWLGAFLTFIGRSKWLGRRRRQQKITSGRNTSPRRAKPSASSPYA